MQAKSEENWMVGNRCLAEGSFNAAANRLYYSVFQAVLMFAVAKRGYVYEGSGVHSAMTHIVQSQGQARLHYGAVFRDLLTLRYTADYDSDSPSGDEIKTLLADSEAIRKYYLKKANT